MRSEADKARFMESIKSLNWEERTKKLQEEYNIKVPVHRRHPRKWDSFTPEEQLQALVRAFKRDPEHPCTCKRNWPNTDKL